MADLNSRSLSKLILFFYVFIMPKFGYCGATDSLNSVTTQAAQQADYYTQKADELKVAADKFIAKGGDCDCACPGRFHTHFFGKCESEEITYRCIGMGMLKKSEEYRRQAEHYTTVASQSCKSSNQISSSQSKCTPYTVKRTNTSTEACASGNPANCLGKTAVNTATTTAKFTSSIGTSTMAGAQSAMHAVGLLPDGSFQTKDGKTFKLEDVKDLKALVNNGVPPAFAQAMIEAKHSLDEVEKKAKENLKQDVKDLARSASDNSGAAAAAADYASVAQKNIDDKNSSKLDLYSDYYEETPSKKDKDPTKLDLYSDYYEETPSRGPAYDVEGDRPTLSVKYFGERIGASRENLFRMIKKRYKIKSRSDSFYE